MDNNTDSIYININLYFIFHILVNTRNPQSFIIPSIYRKGKIMISKKQMKTVLYYPNTSFTYFAS